MTAFFFFLMVLLPQIKVAPATACLCTSSPQSEEVSFTNESEVSQQLYGARRISQQLNFKPYSELAPSKKELMRTLPLLDLLCRTFYSAELTVDENHASG